MARGRQARNPTPSLLPDLDAAPVAAPLRPLPASAQELFLPDLVARAAENVQIGAYDERRREARAVVRQWIDRLRSGQLRELTETQVAGTTCVIAPTAQPWEGMIATQT